MKAAAASARSCSSHYRISLGTLLRQKRTHKRGGDLTFISWDEWMAQAPSKATILEQPPESLPPERLFDLRWAMAVVEQALRRLREECEAKGRLRLFEVLSKYLSSERDEISYADLASRTRLDGGNGEKAAPQSAATLPLVVAR